MLTIILVELSKTNLFEVATLAEPGFNGRTIDHDPKLVFFRFLQAPNSSVTFPSSFDFFIFFFFFSENASRVSRLQNRIQLNERVNYFPCFYWSKKGKNQRKIYPWSQPPSPLGASCGNGELSRRANQPLTSVGEW